MKYGKGQLVSECSAKGLWDADANAAEGLYAENLTVNSAERAHWKCEHGHRWVQRVSARMVMEHPEWCPACHKVKKMLVPGFNDLATVRPDLVSLWDDDANGDMKPSDVLTGSFREVTWRCPKGHTWRARVIDVNRNHRCPVCDSSARCKHGSFALEHPDKVAYWDDDANGDLKPDKVSALSNKTVSWVCPKGHKWKSPVSSMSIRKTYCPACDGTRKPVVPGRNDLATLHPELMKEWDYGRNTIDPTMTAEKSGKEAWWICPKGHSWRAIINNRSSIGTGCPQCARRGRPRSKGSSSNRSRMGSLTALVKRFVIGIHGRMRGEG